MAEQTLRPGASVTDLKALTAFLSRVKDWDGNLPQLPARVNQTPVVTMSQSRVDEEFKTLMGRVFNM